MKRSILLALCLPLALPAFAAPPPRATTLLVLDASGSMWGQIGGRSKIELAREAVGEMLGQWSADEALGLMAYGHRRKGDCKDIELLLSPAPGQAQAVAGAVGQLTPKGMTPLSDAVRQAAETLKYTEQPATVILVSDGEETCNADPCALGRELEQLGIDFTAHVIGFDVADNTTARSELKCLAENTGGRYLEAANAAELNSALQQVSQPVAAPTPPPPPAQLKAPDEAEAGSQINVESTGPVGPRAWVGFASKGSEPAAYLSGHYFHPETSPAQLELLVPGEPGDYEIRYVAEEEAGAQILTAHPIRVIEPEARVAGPASVMAGDRVVIQASGPVGGQHWIGFAPAGSEPGAYVSGAYDRPTAKNMELTLNTPMEPGAYEYRYILNESEKVVASQPVTVTEPQATLQAPASAVAGTEIRIAFEGPRADSNWIGFIPPGGDGASYESWVSIPAEGSEVLIWTPQQPGSWDLAFVVNNQVVARQNLQITAGQGGQ